MRFIGLLRADKHSEAGEPPSHELSARMGAFMEEITKAGVMLAPSNAQAARLAARVLREPAEDHALAAGYVANGARGAAGESSAAVDGGRR